MLGGVEKSLLLFGDRDLSAPLEVTVFCHLERNEVESKDLNRYLTKCTPSYSPPKVRGETKVPSPKVGEGQDGVSFSPPKIGGVRDGMKLLFGDRDLSTPLEVTFFFHFDEPPIGGEEKSLPLFDDRDLSATLEVTTTGTCHLDRNGVEWSGAERSIALFSK